MQTTDDFFISPDLIDRIAVNGFTVDNLLNIVDNTDAGSSWFLRGIVTDDTFLRVPAIITIHDGKATSFITLSYHCDVCGDDLAHCPQSNLTRLFWL